MVALMSIMCSMRRAAVRCASVLGLSQEARNVMTAKLYAMTCGRLVGRLKDMIEGEDGQVDAADPVLPDRASQGTRPVRHRHASAMPHRRRRPARRAGGAHLRLRAVRRPGRREVAAGIDRPRSRQGRLHRQFASAFRPRWRQRAGSQRHHGRATARMAGGAGSRDGGQGRLLQGRLRPRPPGEAGRGRARPVRRRQRGLHSDLRPHAGPSVAQGAHGERARSC